MRFFQVTACLALLFAVMTPSIALAQSSSQVQTAVRNALQAAQLSPQQKLKVRPMLEQYQQQTANADAATKKTAKEQLLKNIYGVMTPDQQAKFKASLKASLGSGASP
jgi:uncharacterized membrane protein affecting hemolysin expression